MSTYGSSRPRLGVSPEELEQCPYQSSHWVRSIKLDYHVVKCRLNYEDELRKKGERAYLLNCQYNHLHKVIDAEWKFHMARCPDRKRIWSYQLMAALLKERFPNKLFLTAEELQEDKKELFDMYAGLNVGHLFGIDTDGKHVKLEDIGKDKKQLAQAEAEEKGKALAKEVEEEWRRGGTAKKETVSEPAAYQNRYSQDEIDYWNSPGRNVGTPGFNWMERISQPRGYNIITYPPGLNKRGRREFERKNAEEYEKRIAKAKKEREEGIALLEKFLGEEADREEPLLYLNDEWAGDGKADM